MKLGVNLINLGPGGGPRYISTVGKAVEGLGYYPSGDLDHIAITKDVATKYPAPFYEPVATLGWFRGVTEKIEIGDHCDDRALPEPARDRAIAHQYRSLERRPNLWRRDRLGGGRVRRPQTPFRQRGAMTNDTSWPPLKRFGQRNPQVSTVSTRASAMSARRPCRCGNRTPPIWVGGSSDAAMRRTVRIGDAWHPIRFDENWLRNEGIPRLRQIADEEGGEMPALCPPHSLADFRLVAG